MHNKTLHLEFLYQLELGNIRQFFFGKNPQLILTNLSANSNFKALKQIVILSSVQRMYKYVI